MKIQGKEYRTIWYEGNVVKIIDQTKLPHKFIIKDKYGVWSRMISKNEKV